MLGRAGQWFGSVGTGKSFLLEQFNAVLLLFIVAVECLFFECVLYGETRMLCDNDRKQHQFE